MRDMRYTPQRVMEEVNAAFLRIPKAQVRQLLSRQERLSVKHGMSMFTHRGKARIIQVHLRPWVIDRAQYRFFHRTCMILRGALSRLLPLYLSDPKARQVLPLDPEERQWVLAANAKALQRPQAVVDRLDTTATFTPSDWRQNFWFLEPNSVGIGGVHYIPATCELTAEWILPVLRRMLPDLRIEMQDDIRRLIFKLFIRHAKGIGRRLNRVALVEDQSVNGGTDEFTSVARHFRRLGLSAITADPRDVVIYKDEVTVRGKPVDLIYRDSEITEILEMGGRDKRSIAGIREAFIRNRVISSIAGEFDHKSAWELFTNPEFSRHFTLRQRRLFKGHLLWTRLLWNRKTTSTEGRVVDLVPFSRRHREALVIKPNRAYGGEGVIFGHQVSQAVWERRLDEALRRPFTHVIQQSALVRAELFPVADPDGTVRMTPYYAVTGFAASADGMAVLGRASKEAVVNVSRRGGLIAIWRLG
ncbi:MAG: hypothetical protein HYZ93_05045 [Candidatus Omnitrophica bacterium]|nr:hypothetical protein [Candidatus Omnitrophota bacterium]